MGATTRDIYKKKIITLKELEIKFRETLLWRLGEHIVWAEGVGQCGDVDYMKLAMERIANEPKALSELTTDPGFMLYSLEDYQIVLSHSISANRIIKVLPKESEFGKVKQLIKKREAPRRGYVSPEE